MQQQISVITLGVADLARARRFYVEGFGWAPVFENDEIIFYQMNGLMLGTWLKGALESDMRRPAEAGSGAVALASALLPASLFSRALSSCPARAAAAGYTATAAGCTSSASVAAGQAGIAR